MPRLLKRNKENVNCEFDAYRRNFWKFSEIVLTLTKSVINFINAVISKVSYSAETNLGSK